MYVFWIKVKKIVPKNYFWVYFCSTASFVLFYESLNVFRAKNVSLKYHGSGCRIELKVATLIDLNATICDNLIKSCDTLYFPSFPPSKFSQNPVVHYKCTTGTSSKSTFWQPKWCFFGSLSCDNLRHQKIFQENCLVFPENQFKVFSRFYSQSSYWNAQNPTGFLKIDLKI